MNKLVIIGSGPAGFAAAIYTSRAQLEPVVFAGEKSGGQLMLTTVIENYPGFPDGIDGPELMMRMRKQAEKFGAKIIDQDAVNVDFSNRPFRVNDLEAEAVLITTGAESLQLGANGEKDYIGRGVSYCAVCDAAFFKGKQVYVVGGGDAAMEDTLALTKFAREITVVHRRDAFKASKIMQERVLQGHTDKVKVRWNSEVVEVTGDVKKITGLKIRDTITGEIQEVTAEGLFVAIGHKPATEFLKGQIDLDEKGYIKTGGEFPTMTNISGVFAAGDNVDHRYRQAGTAAGFGIMAALDVERWLER